MYNNPGRTVMSQRNAAFSIAARLVGMITSFVGRSIFVACLGSEYLGLGGFFGNIFAVVSLCELGLGTAISQSLYKPLAENDEYRIAAIMRFFIRAYKVIAFVTVCLSLAAVPLLRYIVKSEIEYEIILVSYLLFSAHTFVSYILAPKRMLVICDQRMYVVTGVRCIFSVAALIIQCAVLVLTGNYILYLACRILVLAIEDTVINRYADKHYPFLALKINPTREYKKSLYSNVKALMWHKIGGTLSRSTDSILVSYFVGLSGMGKYSNYALVIGTVVAFFDVAVNAAGASVGNLGAGDRGKKSEKIMRKMYFINFWLLTVGTGILVCTLNPFIELWLGKEMLFTTFEMLVVVSSFYFSCIRDPVQIFVSSYGLFRQSKYIPIIRALVNLVLSVAFVRSMGIAGVFLGTTLSTLAVPLIGEVYVLYKYGFSLDARGFCKEMAGYISVSVVCAFLSMTVTRNMPATSVGIIVRAVTAFCVTNAILLVTNAEKDYYKDFIMIFKHFFKGKNTNISQM